MQINRANDYQIETQFVKEGDYNGRELVVQITNAGEVSDQTGVSLNLGWRHDSVGNTGLDPFIIVDASKGIFKITYPTEMLIAGDVTASIQVLESGKITLTRNFKITVEDNPIDEGAIVSENSFTVLQEALTRVNNLESNYAPRLNEVTEQLAQTNHKFTIVSIRDFPRLAPEIEDSSRINRAIDSIQEGIVQLYNEVYETKQPIKLKSNITLQGQNPWKTIIKNTGGTNIIETFDTNIRYFNIQLNDMYLLGNKYTGQIGLNIPHTSYLYSKNMIVDSVDIGIYAKALDAEGNVTGAYYNMFVNPHVTRSKTGIYFDEIANENTIFGGKITLCDVGTLILSNSVKFFGTAFEGNHEYHAIFKGFNNSLYSPRFEGYNTSVGILNDPVHPQYPNYVYAPHFQNLKSEVVDNSGRLSVFSDKGWNIPLRTDATSLKSIKEAGGSMPMVDMRQKNTSGSPTVYKSQLTAPTGKHLEGLNMDEVEVYSVNYYGEYENKVPNRGIILTSPNGSRYAVRVNDLGEVITIKL